MAKSKTGLHKKISTIFTGVSIPQSNDTNQPITAPKTTAPSTTVPKPIVPEPTTPKPTVTEPTTPKPLIPETTSPKPKQTQYVPPTILAASKPKPQQPVQPAPKIAPAQMTTVDTVVNTIEQSGLQQILENIKNRFFAPKPGVNTKKQVTITILIPILAIVLIFVLMRALGTSPGNPIEASELTTTASTANSDIKINWNIPEPYPTTLRDPMLPGSVSTNIVDGRPSNLDLKGILYSEQSPSAIIGNKIVHEGEKISDVTILKINKDNVEFEINGKKWTQKVQR